MLVSLSLKSDLYGSFTTNDLCILATSIVAHESELQAISKLKKMKVPVIAIGPFATSLPDPYIKEGAKVIIGEPEFYFLNFNLKITRCL